MTTLWDTTGSDVVKALAAERRSAGALAFGLALTLVVVVDEKCVSDAEAAASAAAAAHPCRLLVVVRRQIDAPQPRLDAELSIGGRLGPGEAVVMRMYGRLALHAESVVLPLLAPDAPVVTWWHDEPPAKIAYDPLGVFADRRVTDVTHCADPIAALQVRAADFAPGDTDLAWTRTTGWRTLLAAAFDSVTETAEAATVVADRNNPSALLFAGWLQSRLRIPVTVEETGARRGIGAVRVRLGGASSGGSGSSGSSSDELTLIRTDSRTASLTRPDQPTRSMPLSDRGLGDLLAEELRRLDDDPVYAEALSAWSGIDRLTGRSPQREHIWVDPMAPPPTTAPPGSPPAPVPAAAGVTAAAAVNTTGGSTGAAGAGAGTSTGGSTTSAGGSATTGDAG